MENKKQTNWFYPDEYWIEATKVIIFSTIIQMGLIIMIGVPNLIFKLTWINYVAWILPLNFIICNIIVLSILIKGLWEKLKEN